MARLQCERRRNTGVLLQASGVSYGTSFLAQEDGKGLWVLTEAQI